MPHGGARIQLCGERVVELGGRRRENALRGCQGRLGFTYLLLLRLRPICLDEHMSALWSEYRMPPRAHALAPVLSRLRPESETSSLEGRHTAPMRLPAAIQFHVEFALAELVA